MKVVGNHAYIVSEANGHGMQVFDLTQLRGRAADPSHEFENTAHMNNFGQAHNIAANPAEQRVYVIGSTDANDCDVGVVCDGACDGGEPRLQRAASMLDNNGLCLCIGSPQVCTWWM